MNQLVVAVVKAEAVLRVLSENPGITLAASTCALCEEAADELRAALPQPTEAKDHD